MITKNSLHPCLKESLDSMFQYVPLNCLILVDSSSSDGTIDLVKKYGNKVKVSEESCLRGKAREIGIKKVETEWFAFIDSDVILAENWFSKIKRYIEPRVGAIEGNVKTEEGRIQTIGPLHAFIPISRAYTNCTLIRTSSVKDIEIPSEMSVFEDQFIRKFVESKGFEWLKVPDPCSIHMSTSNRVQDAFEIGRMSGKYKLFPFQIRLLALLAALMKRPFDRQASFKIYWNAMKGQIRGSFERWI